MGILFLSFCLNDKASLLAKLRSLGLPLATVSSDTEVGSVLSGLRQEITIILCHGVDCIKKRMSFFHEIKACGASFHTLYIIAAIPSNCIHDYYDGNLLGVVDDYVLTPATDEEFFFRVHAAIHRLKKDAAEKKSKNALKSSSFDLKRPNPKPVGSMWTIQIEILSKLLNALEAKDQGTAYHVQRVGSACAYMGELIGWHEARCEIIGLAAMLHDIGKIGIADSILRKAGPLTDEECDIIKSHTLKGAKILSGSKSPVIKKGEEIALCHHENWDGSGYPRGLRNKDIPLVARIVSIVDVYDSLVTDRIYRKAMSPSEALQFIKDNKGIKFEPRLVDIFVQNYDEICKKFIQVGNETF